MSKKLTIKQGEFNLTCPRDLLIEVSETPDGVALNFKGGVSLMKLDQFMPSHTKQLIKNTCDSFPTGDIVIDLANYNKPASVNA
jgi:hypothetical protein